MIVVADTSPLNYLVRLQRVDLLRHLYGQVIYGQVIVPTAVMQELQHPQAPAEVRSWAATPPPWLTPRHVSQLDESLAPELGPGEREAISLALEMNADALLIDELEGRQAAKLRQIAVVGTLAVLLEGALRGYLSLGEELHSLRTLGFRMSPALEAETLALYTRANRRTRT